VQFSDVPDLAHTRPTPMHWMATATAMAGVVAIAGLIQPGDATASQSGSRLTKASAPARHLPAPDPAKVSFPMDCGSVGTVVTHRSTGDLDGDGNPETVAAVTCDAGSGTPPSGIYVITRGHDGAPRLVATLLDPKDRESVGKGFGVRDGAVFATLLGYSSRNVPTCCPDVEKKVSWVWRNGAFVESEQTGDRAV
jgi:hypothetical protein